MDRAGTDRFEWSVIAPAPAAASTALATRAVPADGRIPRTAADWAGCDAATLVMSAAAGERAAWNALVDRFATTVWAVARGHRLSPADAADVSQTTWLRLVENLGRIQQPERVGAWLATTARRESLRVLRLAGRQIPAGDDLDSAPDPTPTTGPDRRLIGLQRDEVVRRLVEQLPARSQLLLRLLNTDPPMSYRDISDSLDIPIGSIGPTRARALEHLRRLARTSGVELEDLMG